MDQSWGSVEKLVAMEGYEDFVDTSVQLLSFVCSTGAANLPCGAYKT